MNFKEAQQWVKEHMQYVLDDNCPDELDDLECRLCEFHGFSDESASQVVNSEWWR